MPDKSTPESNGNRPVEPERDYASFIRRTERISGIGHWQYDLERGCIEWSAQTCIIHDVAEGYAPTLQDAIAFFAPEARPTLEAAIAAATQTGKP